MNCIPWYYREIIKTHSCSNVNENIGLIYFFRPSRLSTMMKRDDPITSPRTVLRTLPVIRIGLLENLVTDQHSLETSFHYLLSMRCPRSMYPMYFKMRSLSTELLITNSQVSKCAGPGLKRQPWPIPVSALISKAPFSLKSTARVLAPIPMYSEGEDCNTSPRLPSPRTSMSSQRPTNSAGFGFHKVSVKFLEYLLSDLPEEEKSTFAPTAPS